MIVLFLGPSGSGKDTQAQIISASSSFQPISTGNLIRDVSNGATRIQSYIRKSILEQFSSDELVYGLLQVYIKYSRGEDFILTGAVRRKSQIGLLDKVLLDINQKLDKVFLFELADEEAIQRLTNRLVCSVCGRNYNIKTLPPRNEDSCDICGSYLTKRDDDTPEAAKNRLAEYHKYYDEIVKEYDRRGILFKIDASDSIDKIHQKIKQILDLQD